MKKFILPTVLLGFMFLFSNCIGYGVKSKSTPYRAFKNQTKLAYAAKDWNDLIIYDTLDPADQYIKIAKIKITGNETSTEWGLLQRLKYEASKYSVDAILLHEIKGVNRNSFDGTSTVLDAITSSESYPEEHISYSALEITGIAINFVEE